MIVSLNAVQHSMNPRITEDNGYMDIIQFSNGSADRMSQQNLQNTSACVDIDIDNLDQENNENDDEMKPKINETRDQLHQDHQVNNS